MASALALRKTWRLVSTEDRFLPGVLKRKYGRKSLFTNLVERMRLDLREFVLHVVGVHGANLLTRGSPKNFDDLDELIYAGLSREQGLTEHKLCHHTTRGPDIYKERVSVECKRGKSYSLPILVV